MLRMATTAIGEREQRVRLTTLSSCGGCGAKLHASDLLPIVDDLPAGADERLLIDHATGDDAAVFCLGDGLAIVQTVDFFTPLVDDPYDFGRIAAANALSDVYAMGATPVTALNVLAFPLQELGEQALRDVLRGGADVIRQAGAALVGGHSIRDREPKYGLAVTGIVDPAALTSNSAGREGDLLVLSKPLGTGAIVTARKRGQGSDRLLQSAIDTMVELNDGTAEEALRAGVRAMTDVSGYGLLGHLHLLCLRSGLAAELDAASVPVLAGVERLLAGGEGMSSGSRGNARWASGFTDVARSVEPWRLQLLVDATTSGGLLAAVPATGGASLDATPIGRLCEGPPGTIVVS